MWWKDIFSIEKANMGCQPQIRDGSRKDLFSKTQSSITSKATYEISIGSSSLSCPFISHPIRRTLLPLEFPLWVNLAAQAFSNYGPCLFIEQWVTLEEQNILIWIKSCSWCHIIKFLNIFVFSSDFKSLDLDIILESTMQWFSVSVGMSMIKTMIYLSFSLISKFVCICMCFSSWACLCVTVFLYECVCLSECVSVGVYMCVYMLLHVSLCVHFSAC